MGETRLRTKFLVAMLLTSATLTILTLLVVQRTMAVRARQGIVSDLENSVESFRTQQVEREATLRASAQLLANLPILKALMTSRHALTIQDGSAELFHLSGRDLLALIDTSGQVVGFHTNPANLPRADIEQMLDGKLPSAKTLAWWVTGGHLYEVYLEPIYFGSSTNGSPLGIVAVGYEINDPLARQVAKLADSNVAVSYGGKVVVSTIRDDRTLDFAKDGRVRNETPTDVTVGGKKFVASSIVLNPDDTVPVTMVVVKSYDNAIAFLRTLRDELLVIGIVAVVLGTLLVYVLARTFTRPLERLAAGVSALGTGDFAFPLLPGGGAEVVGLTGAFTDMRTRLRETQQSLIESERLATIGRMAASISHDLRHPLTAVLANAEFLAEGQLSGAQREELYLEIRLAVNRLTDLVDSLLELSRPAQALTRVDVPLDIMIERAIELVHAHPEFQKVTLRVEMARSIEAQVDARKMERVIYNLLLNACQAVKPTDGHVIARVSETAKGVDIRIVDDGPGVDASIRTKLFEPFVSFGKQNGTGLGLTIAQKIVQDHGGYLELESSTPGETVVLISLPRGTMGGEKNSRARIDVGR
ncbi:MAG TPA: HAMP domain-containing sensor histidine kinase [Candidatus Koribacter sp.]|jgi:signal transduction histidine kinase